MSTVSFSVTGKFLTKHFRDRVLDGEWRKAMNGLKDSLMGIELNMVTDILSGKARIIGDSNDDDISVIYVTSENYTDEWKKEDKKYLDTLDYMYGSLFRQSNGSFYSPYCYITNWGPEDLRDANGETWMGSNRIPTYDQLDGFGAHRCKHYLNNMSRDILVSLNAGELHITTKCYFAFEVSEHQDPPLWIDSPKSFQESLDKHIALGKNLEERGNRQLYGEEKSKLKVLKPKKLKDMSIEELKKENDRLDISIKEHENTIAQSKENIESVITGWLKDGKELVSKTSKKTSDKTPMTQRNQMSLEKSIIIMREAIENSLDDERIKELDECLQESLKLVDNECDRRNNWEDKQERKNYNSLRKAILKQAETSGGLFDLKVEKKDKLGRIRYKTFKVPVAPFEHYALTTYTIGGSAHRDKLPEWETVSPQGMKMYGDNPYHTDWMIGAGLELDALYGGRRYGGGDGGFHDNLSSAVWTAMGDLQDKYIKAYGEHKIVLMTGDGYFHGRATMIEFWDDMSKLDEFDLDIIVVTKYAHPNLVALLDKPHVQGLIVENGGKLCHLAVVSRSKDFKMVRMADATTIIKPGAMLSISTDRRELRIN